MAQWLLDIGHTCTEATADRTPQTLEKRRTEPPDIILQHNLHTPQQEDVLLCALCRTDNKLYVNTFHHEFDYCDAYCQARSLFNKSFTHKVLGIKISCGGSLLWTRSLSAVITCCGNDAIFWADLPKQSSHCHAVTQKHHEEGQTKLGLYL